MMSWFRYVRHADVTAYESAGWRSESDLGPIHGAYSILMKWCGEGEPSAPLLAAE